jgi:hypothetical protein
MKRREEKEELRVSVAAFRVATEGLAFARRRLKAAGLRLSVAELDGMIGAVAALMAPPGDSPETKLLKAAAEQEAGPVETAGETQK